MWNIHSLFFDDSTYFLYIYLSSLLFVFPKKYFSYKSSSSGSRKHFIYYTHSMYTFIPFLFRAIVWAICMNWKHFFLSFLSFLSLTLSNVLHHCCHDLMKNCCSLWMFLFFFSFPYYFSSFLFDHFMLYSIQHTFSIHTHILFSNVRTRHIYSLRAHQRRRRRRKRL